MTLVILSLLNLAELPLVFAQFPNQILQTVMNFVSLLHSSNKIPFLLRIDRVRFKCLKARNRINTGPDKISSLCPQSPFTLPPRQRYPAVFFPAAEVFLFLVGTVPPGKAPRTKRPSVSFSSNSESTLKIQKLSGKH